ncbi:hypothetical protein EB796_006379 [Bugula neritina]|uniref:SLC18B1 n=1 Tax=Bugula neritina TaxID=10212 RepID=A0A7J7K9J1_BUGNE|nr:hypothetical protein EB796_006379 [Bugula neritina]
MYCSLWYEYSTKSYILQQQHNHRFSTDDRRGGIFSWSSYRFWNLQVGWIWWHVLDSGRVLAVLVIPMALVLPNIESEKQQEKKFHHLLVIPGILVLLVHCTVGKTVASAELLELVTFLFLRAESGLFYGIWSLAFMIGCPIASFIATKGFTWSLMILAWCVSIFINLFTGPSPLLDFTFHGKHYLELPLSLIAIEFLFQVLMFVLPFQASLNLAEVNGHSKDSIQTYAAVSGTINSVYALGNMIGPIMGGAITENLNFPWMLTVMAFIEIVLIIIKCYSTFIKGPQLQVFTLLVGYYGYILTCNENFSTTS